MKLTTLRKAQISATKLKQAHAQIESIHYGPRAGTPGSDNWKISREILARLVALSNCLPGESMELTDIAESIPGDSGNYYLIHARAGKQAKHLSVKVRIEMFVDVTRETKKEIEGVTLAAKGVRGRVFVTIV